MQTKNTNIQLSLITIFPTWHKNKEFEQFLHQKKNSNSKVHTFTNLTRSEIDRVKELMPDAKEITYKCNISVTAPTTKKKQTLCYK